MGLSGTGKSSLAKPLAEMLDATYLNADDIRSKAQDWDFSPEGRNRQALRMRNLADKAKGVVVLDFICPLPEHRGIVKADYTIWVNTKSTSKYSDTDTLFVPPKYYNKAIEKMSTKNIVSMYNAINKEIH